MVNNSLVNLLTALRNDDVADDIRCAQHIKKLQGFRAWYSPRKPCTSSVLPRCWTVLRNPLTYWQVKDALSKNNATECVFLITVRGQVVLRSPNDLVISLEKELLNNDGHHYFISFLLAAYLLPYFVPYEKPESQQWTDLTVIWIE